VADHVPRLTSVNSFNRYKLEPWASNDGVNWTVTSHTIVPSSYYDRLNPTEDGRRHFLHSDYHAGYVYRWNSSLEGSTAGPARFRASVSTSAPVTDGLTDALDNELDGSALELHRARIP